MKEIAAALVGMKAGDKKEISVTFPSDFANEELREKTAIYAIDVAEVRERVLPEMNEEFFKNLHVADEAALKQTRKTPRNRKRANS